MKKYRLHVIRLLIMLVVLVAAMNDFTDVHALTQEEDNRTEQLFSEGWSDAVVADQLDEEFRGKDGKYGTGGIDGLLLNGQPAGGGSSTGSGTTQKPAHTHTWEVVSQEDGNCKTNGKIVWKCSGCGKEKTEKLDKGDHDYEVTEHMDATCYSRETYVYTCSVCGDSYTYEAGELKDHDWIPAEDDVEPTCESKGYKHEYCTVCGAEITEDLPALGHTWEDDYTTDVPATCTTDGEKSIHCKTCGKRDEETVVVIKAFGHTENPKHNITEPAFWEDGSEVITCLTCGEVLDTILIPKTGGWKVITPFAVGGGILLVAIVIGILVIAKRKK